MIINNSNKLPKRNEIPEEFTWNLADIYESIEGFEKALVEIQEMTQKLASYEGKLKNDPEDLYDYLKLEDEFSIEISKLYGYANMLSDQDTANGEALSMKGKALNAYIAAGAATAFETPEILEISDENLENFYKNKPELKVYKRKLDFLRIQKQHVLSKECEALLAAAGEMAEAPEQIYGQLENADMKFPDVPDKDGNMHMLTQGTFVQLLESDDRVLRKNAYDAYYHVLGGLKNTIAAALNGQFRQLVFFANARKYKDTLTAALEGNEVPTEVYTGLIDAVHNNLDKMYKYVALRKRLLGVDELRMYDVYTPIVKETAKKIDYETAKKTVREGLKVLGDDYIALLDRGFNERWIDVYENEGKRSGAYSSGNAIPHPFVLLNHKDNLDSMFTIAHEMGHALHSYHSNENQPVSTSDYVIFVAEVASTCNEVLLMKYLLANSNDKNEKIYLINHFLDQFKGTLYRQTMFAEFELFLGRTAEQGETLTAELLTEKYRELNKLYFGPDMITDDNIALEWARIPHFYYNYYVFQYATGISAAVAIANKILKEGKTAADNYKKFLSGGSSTDPISLLKIAGVDMSTPEPVNDALKLFGELVDELEELTK